MKRFFFVPLLVLLASCAAQRDMLPDLQEMRARPETQACGAVFPSGRWQFVHSIEFAMQDGSGSTALGVTTLAPDRLDCALLTPEGFTLFAASLHGQEDFKVSRAVPPFDKPAFAKGLLADIQAIFRPPAGPARQGPAVCRFAGADGRTTDVLETEGCWQLRTYGPDRLLERSVTGRGCVRKNAAAVPQGIELKAYGPAGYTLKMTLIRADCLEF